MGERSHTVRAYCVNTLAGEVFTRVNTPSWQVFTHLPVNPKKTLCGTRLVDAVASDSRPTVVPVTTVSASYSSVEDLCAY